MRPIITIREALTDPKLLGAILPGDSWLPWRVLLIATMGEALTDDERVIFERLTGRKHEPGQRVAEFWGTIGRRGGKTRAGAVLAVYIAALCDHSENLAIGERGLGLFLAQNAKQATIAFNYAAGIIDAVDMLRGMVVNRTADTISLRNGIDLEVRPASFRGLRGVTCIFVIGDEVSYWYTDESAANADVEVLGAVRPSLITTNGLLAIFSSPYAKKGEVYNTYRRDYGADGDPLVLVAHGTSRDLNPSLSQVVVDRALAREGVAARCEYLAEFRDDVSGYIAREIIEACVDYGVTVRPPRPGIRYASFIDASGGVRDSFTAGIAHAEDGAAILDCTVEIMAPFNSIEATARVASVLKSYRIARTAGDRYGASWVVDAFAKHNIKLEHSERDRSAIYADLVPLLTAGNARLIDSKRLVSQLASLERRVTSMGRDRIDHGPGGSDDVANSAAGALVMVGKGKQPIVFSQAELSAIQAYGRTGRAPMPNRAPQAEEPQDIPRGWVAQSPSHFERWQRK
jgi:hypothetical protein